MIVEGQDQTNSCIGEKLMISNRECRGENLNVQAWLPGIEHDKDLTVEELNQVAMFEDTSKLIAVTS